MPTPASPATPKRARAVKTYVDADAFDVDSDADGSSPFIPAADDDDDDELDIKPDVPDDDSDGGSPRKKARGKSSPSTPRKRAGPSSPRKPRTPKEGGSSAGKWTAGEDWQLFCALHPKVDKPAWAAIAALIGNGRDAKNRYATFSKRLEAAIKGISVGH